MSRKTFRGGVHPNDQKGYSRDAAFVPYEPKGELVFPVGQHIGKPAKAVVKKNDVVLAGQIIAEADGFVSANIISSVSGKVKAVENRRTVAGVMQESIVIVSDGAYTLAEGVGVKADYTKMTGKEIIDKVKAAGIVGMGGAGFPTHVKLMPKDPSAIKYIIANGAECEPYITCDDQLMRTRSAEIVTGMQVILKLFPGAEGIILIEENKPEAIKAMTEACSGADGVRVMPVMTKYPQGGERSIIQMVAGIDLKLGMLPADAGCIVDNVATINAIYEAVCLNTPLMKRGVTVSGDAVAKPSNLIVPIGTNQAELLEAAGGIKEGVNPKKVLSGGPMMGIAMASLDIPLQKANNAITVLKNDDVEEAMGQMSACLRCARCNNICPLGLTPQMMAVAAEKKDYERYEKKLFGLECIACGSCTYICPAKRPLMQLFKQAKSEIMAAKRAEGGKK